MSLVFFFFFKQKTAYEMRISDWSSDVCSSDLLPCMRRGMVMTVPLGRGSVSWSGGSGAAALPRRFFVFVGCRIRRCPPGQHAHGGAVQRVEVDRKSVV